MEAVSGVEFAAYVPFYPDCMTTFLSDTEVVNRPIRIFGGTLDDYNPISACKVYAERLRAASRDVEVTEYPSASHSFDNPLGAQPAKIQPTFESVWGAAMAWRTGACAQAGDLPAGPHQTSVHTEGQRQTQAAGDRDMDFIMHLVQLGFGDVRPCGASWQPNPAACDLSRR